ncbi:MAG: hypothetical protein R3A52_06425 [Polyangiales bacterium]
MTFRGVFGLAVLLAVFAGCTGASVVGGGSGGGSDASLDSTVTDAPSCTSQQLACGGRCVDPQTDGQNCGACGNACGAMQACVMGSCQAQCPSPQTACNGACVNLQTDAQNCGACGRACGAGQVCSLGRCDVACAPTLTTCMSAAQTDGGTPSYCADTMTDRENCGACGNACPRATCARAARARCRAPRGRPRATGRA